MFTDVAIKEASTNYFVKFLEGKGLVLKVVYKHAKSSIEFERHIPPY